MQQLPNSWGFRNIGTSKRKTTRQGGEKGLFLRCGASTRRFLELWSREAVDRTVTSAIPKCRFWGRWTGTRVMYSSSCEKAPHQVVNPSVTNAVSSADLKGQTGTWWNEKDGIWRWHSWVCALYWNLKHKRCCLVENICLIQYCSSYGRDNYRYISLILRPRFPYLELPIPKVLQT